METWDGIIEKLLQIIKQIFIQMHRVVCLSQCTFCLNINLYIQYYNLCTLSVALAEFLLPSHTCTKKNIGPSTSFQSSRQRCERQTDHKDQKRWNNKYRNANKEKCKMGQHLNTTSQCHVWIPATALEPKDILCLFLQ